RAAVTVVIFRAIVWPTRLLWRSVEANVTDVSAKTQWNTDGLNSTVQVLIVQSVLIVPDSGTWIGNFVAHEPDTVVSGIRLDLAQKSAGPGPCRDSRPPPNCVTDRGKTEVRCAAHHELATGARVIHVTLAGMALAPRVFMRGDILGFGKVGCALIKVLI